MKRSINAWQGVVLASAVVITAFALQHRGVGQDGLHLSWVADSEAHQDPPTHDEEVHEFHFAPPQSGHNEEERLTLTSRTHDGGSANIILRFQQNAQPLQQRIERAAAALGEAEGDKARAEAKKQLAKLLEEYFELDMKQRTEEIQQIERRLAKLRERLGQRQSSKQRIIELQMQVYENEAAGLGFFRSPARWRNITAPAQFPPAVQMRTTPRVARPAAVSVAPNIPSVDVALPSVFDPAAPRSTGSSADSIDVDVELELADEQVESSDNADNSDEGDDSLFLDNAVGE